MKWTPIRGEYHSELERMKGLDPYELLEIAQNASLEEIKKAYRSKVKIYHPDGADEFLMDYILEVTKLLNDAYKTILEEREEHG